MLLVCTLYCITLYGTRVYTVLYRDTVLLYTPVSSSVACLYADLYILVVYTVIWYIV